MAPRFGGEEPIPAIKFRPEKHSEALGTSLQDPNFSLAREDMFSFAKTSLVNCDPCDQ